MTDHVPPEVGGTSGEWNASRNHRTPLPVIISHSLRFTFVHIHKPGGTSIENGRRHAP